MQFGRVENKTQCCFELVLISNEIEIALYGCMTILLIRFLKILMLHARVTSSRYAAFESNPIRLLDTHLGEHLTHSNISLSLVLRHVLNT